MTKIKFQPGDYLTIIDIHPEDKFFPEKEKLIGKRGFLRREVLPYKDGFNFVSGLLHLIRSNKALFFYKVKLERVYHENGVD